MVSQFLHQQNLTLNPDRVGSFQLLIEVLKLTRFVTYKHSATHPVQQIFLPLKFWVVMWPAVASLPTTKGGRGERA